ncbi:unnamed protein product [Aphanomyces euteiches]
MTLKQLGWQCGEEEEDALHPDLQHQVEGFRAGLRADATKSYLGIFIQRNDNFVVIIHNIIAVFWPGQIDQEPILPTVSHDHTSKISKRE